MSDLFISLILVALITTFTPGPGTVLTSAMGARFGFRRSVPLMAGTAGGLAALMAVAAAGLATMLLSAPTFQLAMKMLGSAYLIWLSWKIGRSGAPDIGSDKSVAPAGFWAGLVLLWLNPKAWVMALGSTAAYVGLAAGPVRLALLLGAVFGVSAMLALCCWCLGEQMLGRALRTAGQWRAVNAVLGLLTAVPVVPLWLS